MKLDINVFSWGAVFCVAIFQENLIKAFWKSEKKSEEKNEGGITEYLFYFSYFIVCLKHIGKSIADLNHF